MGLGRTGYNPEMIQRTALFRIYMYMPWAFEVEKAFQVVPPLRMSRAVGTGPAGAAASGPKLAAPHVRTDSIIFTSAA